MRAVKYLGGTERDGDIEFAAHRHAVESGGRDADHLEGMAFERNGAADSSGSASVVGLPEAIAENCESRAASTIVIRREQAAGGGLQTKRVEEISAHPQAIGVLHHATFGKIEFLRAPGEGS